MHLDSSPKASATVNKNLHLLSKETIQDTVNMLSTPTRRNRFMFGNHAANMNDDSPVLSQEPINISWKWNNESTPIRSASKASKLRRSIVNGSSSSKTTTTTTSPHPSHHLQRASIRRIGDERSNQIGAVRTASTPKLISVEPETHSPKGLYKFQEEMRKIQLDTESDASCDNVIDKSATVDTGYPNHTNQTNSCNDSLVFHMDGIEEAERVAELPPLPLQPKQTITSSSTSALPQNGNIQIDDELADDLLNDSDFDQILLTCQIPAQKDQRPQTTTTMTTTTITATSVSPPQQTSVKKASSAPEIKTSQSNSSNGSNWNLPDDDCFDDLIMDIDIDSLNTSAKFTRHKSMPQQPQTPSTSRGAQQRFANPPNRTPNQMNRKNFIRHESMPITMNKSIPSNSHTINHNNNISIQQTASTLNSNDFAHFYSFFFQYSIV